jgi:hypothetical protein
VRIPIPLFQSLFNFHHSFSYYSHKQFQVTMVKIQTRNTNQRRIPTTSTSQFSVIIAVSPFPLFLMYVLLLLTTNLLILSYHIISCFKLSNLKLIELGIKI